jgi:hypothetical protein
MKACTSGRMSTAGKAPKPASAPKPATKQALGPVKDGTIIALRSNDTHPARRPGPEFGCRLMESKNQHVGKTQKQIQDKTKHSKAARGPEFLSSEYWKLPMIPENSGYLGPYHPDLGYQVFVNQWPEEFRAGYEKYIPNELVRSYKILRTKTKWFGNKASRTSIATDVAPKSSEHLDCDPVDV